MKKIFSISRSIMIILSTINIGCRVPNKNTIAEQTKNHETDNIPTDSLEKISDIYLEYFQKKYPYLMKNNSISYYKEEDLDGDGIKEALITFKRNHIANNFLLHNKNGQIQQLLNRKNVQMKLVKLKGLSNYFIYSFKNSIGWGGFRLDKMESNDKIIEFYKTEQDESSINKLMDFDQDSIYDGATKYISNFDYKKSSTTTFEFGGNNFITTKTTIGREHYLFIKKEKYNYDYEDEFGTPWKKTKTSRYKLSISGKGYYATEEGIGRLLIKDKKEKVTYIVSVINDKQTQISVLNYEIKDEDLGQFFIIIGYSYGSITTGGDVYFIDLNKGQKDCVYICDNKEMVEKATFDNGRIKLYYKYFTDDNQNEFIRKTKFLK